MNLLVPLLLASLLPHGTVQDPPRRGRPSRSGRITLPPTTQPPTTQPPTTRRPDQKPTVQRRDDVASFRRDVFDLRRSKSLKPEVEQRLLAGLEGRYRNPGDLAIQLAGTVRKDEFFGLLKVLHRYGTKLHIDKLHFLMMSRPLGFATAPAVTTVIEKSDPSRARQYLFDYLTARYAPLRAAAARELPDLLSTEDIPQLLRLSRDPKADIRRKVVHLLGGLEDPRVRKRIVQILTSDPALAADACVAAAKQGEAIAPDLVALLSRPARGRGFGYAAVALVRIEKARGKPMITDAIVPHLVKELGGTDALLRSTAAIALGAHAHRAPTWKNRAREDRRIVDGLLDLVAPEAFIPSLQLLQPLALDVLVRFCGRNFRSQSDAWRGWWAESRGAFRGLRDQIAVDAGNASKALLTWSAGEHSLCFRGVDAQALDVPAGAKDHYLSAEQMLELLEQLRSLGFMAPAPLPQTGEPWTVELRLDGERTLQRLDPEEGARIHQAMVGVARRELWQRYRDPAAAPDRLAFWRAEQKWLAAHQGEENQRLLDHILARLPSLKADELRSQALDDLQSIPDLPKLIKEEHARVLVETADALANLSESDFRLLEVAMLAPGDTTWRRAIGVLGGQVNGANDKFAGRLFRLLGPQRVVTCVRHSDAKIATAAMIDVAANRNQAAVPNLMKRLDDPDRGLRRTAIYALGVLRAKPALQPLLAVETKAEGQMRREIWGALGRIGGPDVPKVLRRAMESPDLDDKLAALSAMGHTRDPDLAQFLAARYVTRADQQDAFSQRAEVSLRQLGALLAIPALRPHLQMQDGPARERLVQLLGSFQDPMVTRDLIDMLRTKRLEPVATKLLAEITGVDLRSFDDRARRMFAWFAENRSRTQAEWFLAALARAKISTTLTAAQLTRSSGTRAVAELTRLLVGFEEPHLRVLAGALLRETTGRDFTAGIRVADRASRESIAERYRLLIDDK